MELFQGDIVRLRRVHPCGCNQWEILRTGADFRLRCQGCGREVWLTRSILEKKIKEVISRGEGL